MLVVVMLPLTRKIECGNGALIDTLEAWAQTVFRLISKASATALMTLWTSILARWSTFGVVRPEELGSLDAEPWQLPVLLCAAAEPARAAASSVRSVRAGISGPACADWAGRGSDGWWGGCVPLETALWLAGVVMLH